jgi:class 3 adenylate cyclase
LTGAPINAFLSYCMAGEGAMSENRKIAAILVADVVGYSRLAGVDEDRTLARLRALRSDLIDPTIDVHRGRVVKRTGDGLLAEFRSVVDAVRCAIELQHGAIERNAGVPVEHRIEFRIGVHLGDVVEEADGDLMGDGVNIAARLEGIAKPGAICLSEDSYRQVSGRLDMAITDLGPIELKNIGRPIRVYSLQVGEPSQAPATASKKSAPPRLSMIVLPFADIGGDPILKALESGDPVTVNDVIKPFADRVRMRLEKLRVRGVVVREGRGRSHREFTYKLVRPDRAAKAIGETGGCLSRAPKQKKNGDSGLHREF